MAGESHTLVKVGNIREVREKREDAEGELERQALLQFQRIR